MNALKIDSPGDLGAAVKKKRKTSGLTQADAAALCNVGVRFISDLENGKETLHIGKVLRVVKAFGYEVGLRERRLTNDEPA